MSRFASPGTSSGDLTATNADVLRKRPGHTQPVQCKELQLARGESAMFSQSASCLFMLSAKLRMGTIITTTSERVGWFSWFSSVLSMEE